MNTSAGDETMNTLTDATIALEAAEREVRIAELRINTQLPTLSMREKIADRARLHAADEALEAARAAYAAAQDQDAPAH